ncbi:MAG TPA: thiol reductant ABC exporter subunit CydC, partial [Anaerolineaceae bacterium]|nr:thiol reductant ABC exporter subunit CydC [Anaerolineaceae bacterium]
MKNLIRLLSFLKPSARQVFLSLMAGLATIAAGVGMLGTSAYLISAAALHPSIAELQVAIVGVRFFGISRGVFRYAERLVSHSVNLKVLSNIRVWFYQHLEPLAPARLQESQSGDLLQRAVGDIEILENFYVRFVMPLIVGILASLAASLFISTLYAPLGWIL